MSKSHAEYLRSITPEPPLTPIELARILNPGDPTLAQSFQDKRDEDIVFGFRCLFKKLEVLTTIKEENRNKVIKMVALSLAHTYEQGYKLALEPKLTPEAITKAADEARERVSGYSPAKRAALLKKARAAIRKGTGFTLIEILVVLGIIAITAALIIPKVMQTNLRNAISKAHPQANVAPSDPKAYLAPVFDMSTHPSSGPDIDPATISPTNDGYHIDLDGDGIADYVILSGQNELSWTKGPSDHSPVVVLRIKGNIMAYAVLVRPGDTRPSVLFWNDKKKGYFQTCGGLNDRGIPYFGEVESQ